MTFFRSLLTVFYFSCKKNACFTAGKSFVFQSKYQDSAPDRLALQSFGGTELVFSGGYLVGCVPRFALQNLVGKELALRCKAC